MPSCASGRFFISLAVRSTHASREQRALFLATATVAMLIPARRAAVLNPVDVVRELRREFHTELRAYPGVSMLQALALHRQG
jgi:hypothetical protein